LYECGLGKINGTATQKPYYIKSTFIPNPTGVIREHKPSYFLKYLEKIGNSERF
jgi:hypothetical protein